MINLLALIGAGAVVYAGYNIYLAYKAKIAAGKTPAAPVKEGDK
jgi:hypothetical protein